ncbi:helix-turn-helix domain-containing protein [Lutimaribacter sp. EGI FJ00015]|uniref:Helix-turn-helix domain-containing protein n=1 Tax=Lutimaribacter degradans TaxID=2945989 RepID=A0ACC5ZTK5_9RHOB|nr:helix-turn-helix transcriptional regulator [Lutimaribacter sp. EGI FJ00013]MCM2560744.1 helix-turn-helix domain-containing protein [Lutimaribacter sp. EGI FJ00013]MCO0612310.1 helix-turn-helix domain-containing protein [Lutimaribacter sp. EGI FJ00015]MCO0634569.1 helix-turn-helix domain-containing protein [Lutimaribacter sp. EGI FJ00014]
MIQNIDKRRRATQFRNRLDQAMKAAGLSQSALARTIGVDRSTISQLLKDDGARLPNAQVVGECAACLGISADWLLSLSDRPESAADLLASSLTLTEAARAPVDQQIFDWHQEAAGYKIRHVPAGLPDMLKTPEMMEWEYAPHLGRTASQAIGASQDRLEWMHSAPSDYEIAVPVFELVSFASATGYYEGLPAATRHAQIDRFLELHAAFYPRLRLYVFDARRLYSAPLTVFGPLLAVLYVGQTYMAFRDSNRVQAFGAHFDHLVREAQVGARDAAAYIETLRARID